MIARVFVSLKTTVLDPQGQAVCSALHGLGHPSVADVRQGKFFELALAPGLTTDQAREEVDRIARDVLANPVIEEYKIELID
jgi:phosphoribosylformylglycinamidine synthase subunit PurS